MVKGGELGRIVTASIQEYGVAGPLESKKQVWIERWEALLGKVEEVSENSVESAVSVLIAFENGAIVRLFIDTLDEEPVTNFEIVGTERLLIWKPDVRALSVTRTERTCDHSYAHLFAADLRTEERI